MNSWYKRYNEHQLHKELKAINALIDGAALNIKDPNLLESYERLVAVIKHCSAFVASLDPNLTSLPYLKTLTDPLLPLKSNLEAFIKSQNPANLQAANEQADTLSLRFPSHLLPSSQTAAIAAYEDFSKQLSSILTSVTQEAKKATDQVQAAASAGNRVDERLKQLDQSIEQQKGRLDKAISDFQKQFSESETERRKQIEQTERAHADTFTAFREDIGKQIKRFTEQSHKDVAAVLEEFKRHAQEAVAELETRKKQASDLVQITANITVTGDYENRATQEMKAANRWRRVAIGFMVILILAAAVILGFSFHDAFDWKMVVFRYATAIILVFPAAYAMSESSHHRKMEQKYRRMQLELSSIDPFIESLPKEQRDVLKKALADRMFAQAEPAEKEPAISVKKVFGLAEKAVEGAGKR